MLVAVAWVANGVLVAWRRDGVDPVTTAQGLFAWDGAYYRDLAELGYRLVSPDSIRFHPLLPVAGVNGAGILVLVNVVALLAAALVHRAVVEVSGGDGDAARRAATLVGIAAPAFCLVWAYAEAPFLLLATGQLLAVRWRRWWWAAAFGALASLARPSGLLLAIPALLEARWPSAPARPRAIPPPNLPRERARTGREGAAGSRSGWVAAVVGPAAGTGLFLWFAGEVTGDRLAPLRVQDHLRGGFVLPPLRLLQGLGELVTDPLGDGLHVPFAFGAVALLVVCWRRLPVSWAALATASVVVNLGAENLNSTERYAYGTVPLLVALALVTGGRWWRPTVLLSSLGFVAMTTLAWYGSLVP